MRKAVSILIVFCVLAAIPVFEASGASIAISRLSKKTAGPFDVIKIYGAGFTSATDMRVIFAKGAYVVSIPALCGTKTTIDVPVPFFMDKNTGVIKAGVVNVTVKSKSLGIKSNTLTGFNITDLPRTSKAAGTVTQEFLEDMKTLTSCADGQLEFLQKASKGKVNTVKARAQVSKMSTNLGALQTALAAIQSTKAVDGAGSVKINKAALAVSDRLILGYLAQLDAVAKAPLDTGMRAAPERDWVTPDGLTIPRLMAIYEKMASYAAEKGFDEQKLWEFLKRNEAAVGTAASLLSMAAAGLGFPAVAAAAGGVALVYSCAIAAYTIMDYMAFYSGLPSGVTEADGFWPLFQALLNTSLAVYGFRLPDISKMKAMLDLYGQFMSDWDLFKRLIEPVKQSAGVIYQQMVQITVEGSWGGKMTWNEAALEGSLTAEFVETGQYFSGTLNMNSGNLILNVTGTKIGYNVYFSGTYEGEIGTVKFTDVFEFKGGFAAVGTSMSGTFKLTETNNISGVVINTGTWILDP